MKKKTSTEKEERETFISFLQTAEQKKRLALLAGLYFLIYIIITWLYPYPASISDSGSYVRAAMVNSMDTYRPFGYSKFLIILHGFSHSVKFVVFIQFLLNALASLLMVFSVSYLFRPKGKIVFYIYASLALFSPLSVYLANSVLSDSLFASLTLFWAASGLWMIFSEKKIIKIILWGIHVILLVFLIKVRYTGLIYIAVTLLFIFLSFFRENKLIWLALSVIPLLIIFSYYNNQKEKTFKLVHVRTFSGFGGWQLANNALHCIPYVSLKPEEIKSEPVRRFTRFVLQHDSLLTLTVKPSAKFMWDNTLPLKAYCFSEVRRTNTPYIYQWNYLGENVYSKFGSIVIKKYPFKFTWHYLLPNCRLILYPDQDQVVKRFRTDGIPEDLLREWFDFGKDEKLRSRSKVYEKMFFLIPLFRLVIWVLFLSALLFLLLKWNKLGWSTSQKEIFWTLTAFVAVYYAFSAYAGPFELRYMAPLHVLLISLIYITFNSTGLYSGYETNVTD